MIEQSKSDIAHNMAVITDRIKQACSKAKRNPNTVRLLLASKTVDVPRIEHALSLMDKPLMGENRVQELEQKCPKLSQPHPEVHFIGHLQSNKIKQVLRWADCIQSVDRPSLAKKLQNRLLFEDKHMDILVQVNTSYEDSKFGVKPEQALDLVKKISEFDRIHIKGLMTIGLFSADKDKVRACFQRLVSIRQEIESQQIPGVEMAELSMGMSGDLEIAIEEGATIIRVGTAIFGERQYPDSYYWNEQRT
ncbi:MAG: YggS family pyridoxal phosphate-dependent enzyme [Proteobacteria bacterium]|nr:MAG: YggS family pyridoxal phosphate-dependent enzyme [Pseudomonadota bacterium]